MSYFRRVGRLLPEPLKTLGAWILVGADRYRGHNTYTASWEGHDFTFGYWDRFTYGVAPTLIEDGAVGHEEVSLRYLELPEGCDGVLDIGAHLGAYTVPLAILNESLPVHAFEPDPYNAKILSRNLALNKLSSPRVAVHQKLVSDNGGKTTFYRDRSRKGPVAGTMHPTENDAEYEPVESNVIDIANFCVEQDIRSPWVKIDAEGEEVAILEQLLNTDAVDSVMGMVELHLNRDGVSRSWLESLAAERDLITAEVKGTYKDSNPAFLFADSGLAYWAM